MHKIKLLTLLTLVGYAAVPQNAWAADLSRSKPVDPGCTVSGLVEGSVLGDYHNFPNAAAAADTNRTYIQGNGTGGIDYNCGHWNFQGIAGVQNTFPNHYNYGANGETDNSIYGYGEVDVFWRDPQSYAVGLGFSREMEDVHRVSDGTSAGVDFHDSYDWWHGQTFAEAYMNNVTLGLGAFYRAGNYNNGFTPSVNPTQNYGAGAYARYYASPNLRLSLRGSVSANGFQYASYSTSGNFYTATLSGDYKLTDSPVSFYSGVRYGASSVTRSDTGVVTPSNYLQGFVGVAIALGPHARDSLIDSDRNGVWLH